MIRGVTLVKSLIIKTRPETEIGTEGLPIHQGIRQTSIWWEGSLAAPCGGVLGWNPTGGWALHP